MVRQILIEATEVRVETTLVMYQVASATARASSSSSSSISRYSAFSV
jgi:hypothetical protein